MQNGFFQLLGAHGIVLDVKVVPGSSRDQIVGVLGTALKVKVAAPAEGGKANQAVCELLAEMLEISTQQVQIVAGQTTSRKRIEVRGIDAVTAMARLIPGQA